MIKDYIFTSESVTEGHPDKMADGISDAVLDAMLEQDPYSRVACETMITTGMVVLAGEITSKSTVDFQDVVRKKVLDIGYDDSAKGFDGNTCSVLVSLDKQSPDIAQGVNQGEGSYKEQGAGDQGLMFGYAVNETKSYMPLTIDLSHQLSKKLTDVRKTGIIPELRPDGKTQVSAEYADGVLKRIEAIVVSSQHSENFSLKQVQELSNASLDKDLFEKLQMDVKDEAGFRDEISKRMEKEVDAQEKDLTKESIYETLLKTNSFFVPKTTVKEQADLMRKDALMRIGQTEDNAGDDLFPVDTFMENAEKRVKLDLLFAELVKHFEISVDAKILDNFINEESEKYKDAEQFKQWVKNQPQQLEQYRMIALEKQLIEKLENALKSKNKVIKFSELANK